MFVVSGSKHWAPGQQGVRFDTIEKAEEWILRDCKETVGKYLTAWYVYEVETVHVSVYRPTINIKVVTPGEEDEPAE
jgi:hypothetical protein